MPYFNPFDGLKLLEIPVSQLYFVQQKEVCVIIGPDTSLHSIRYFPWLINILWSIVYRWAMKEAERLRNNEIMLGH